MVKEWGTGIRSYGFLRFIDLLDYYDSNIGWIKHNGPVFLTVRPENKISDNNEENANSVLLGCVVSSANPISIPFTSNSSESLCLRFVIDL